MAARFASGKNALGLCDICGFNQKLVELRTVFQKGKDTHLKACKTCWDADHPQLRLGEYIVEDPQALRDPRPDSAELDDSRQLSGESYEDWVKKVR